MCEAVRSPVPRRRSKGAYSVSGVVFSTVEPCASVVFLSGREYYVLPRQLDCHSRDGGSWSSDETCRL